MSFPQLLVAANRHSKVSLVDYLGSRYYFLAPKQMVLRI